MYTFVSPFGLKLGTGVTPELVGGCGLKRQRAYVRKDVRVAASDGELNDLMKGFNEKFNPSHDKEFAVGDWRGLTRVIALIYKQGDAEGIYSIALGDDTDVIVTFEGKEDAIRFSGMLEAENFPEGGSLEFVETSVIDDICKLTGASHVCVPEGVTIFPPTGHNTRSLEDWEQREDRKTATDKDLNNVKKLLDNLYDSS
ncbi:hypothetical protein NDN08_000945 [Rhodosorus marinus]|uniref:Glutamine amidotransferase type-2 domain-containing protein n=1 Tax=Rhodosorus marinus TaxID=101924 RepID=A0AAV8UT18_9RHOD|nr:hypothetical protein NDN08_000945 [Rhodosorus marinus]